MSLVIIEPPSGLNINLPNQDVAFGATLLSAPVVDLHCCPWPAKRYLDRDAERIAISRRTFNLSAARQIVADLTRYRPHVEVVDLEGPVNVQCCYAFVREQEAFVCGVPFGDQLPFPDYTLFDSFPLLRTFWSSGLWAYAIMTSHGCPYGCDFCAARRRPWLARSAEHAVGELQRAKRDYGIVSFEIIDDVFNIRRERVLEFCRLVEPLGLRWACTNGLRANIFDDEIAAAMARSGCVHVGFGIETTDEGVLKRNNKGVTFGKIRKAVAAALRHIPRVSGFFIIGLPGSSETIDLSTVAWAREVGVDGMFSMYLPDSDQSSDEIFYGADVRPRGDAYPRERQQAVYRAAKQIKRNRYMSMLTQGRLARQTAAALWQGDWTMTWCAFLYLAEMQCG